MTPYGALVHGQGSVEQIASEVIKRNGYKAIGGYLNNWGGNLTAAYVMNNDVWFFDPNFGQYKFSNKESFVTWFKHTLFRMNYGIHVPATMAEIQHYHGMFWVTKVTSGLGEADLSAITLIELRFASASADRRRDSFQEPGKAGAADVLKTIASLRHVAIPAYGDFIAKTRASSLASGAADGYITAKTSTIGNMVAT